MKSYTRTHPNGDSTVAQTGARFQRAAVEKFYHRFKRLERMAWVQLGVANSILVLPTITVRALQQITVVLNQRFWPAFFPIDLVEESP